MSEFISHYPNGEPFVHFNTQMGQIQANRGNSTLFLHNFENAGADHLFIQLEETEDNYQGIFMWRVVMNGMNEDLFPQLASDLQENEWDVLICDKPSEEDQAVFDRFMDSQFVKVTNKKIRRWLDAGED